MKFFCVCKFLVSLFIIFLVFLFFKVLVKSFLVYFKLLVLMYWLDWKIVKNSFKIVVLICLFVLFNCMICLEIFVIELMFKCFKILFVVSLFIWMSKIVIFLFMESLFNWVFCLGVSLVVIFNLLFFNFLRCLKRFYFWLGV